MRRLFAIQIKFQVVVVHWIIDLFCLNVMRGQL